MILLTEKHLCAISDNNVTPYVLAIKQRDIFALLQNSVTLFLRLYFLWCFALLYSQGLQYKPLILLLWLLLLMFLFLVGFT